MGYDDLIGSLRRGADEQVRTLWQEAGAEAEKITADGERRAEVFRKELRTVLSSEISGVTGRIIADAENRARTVRLSAEAALSERLFALSLSCLGGLRDERYGEVFIRMAEELPVFSWTLVRVNPEDIRIAGKYFGGAEIVPDRGITGGMDVMSEAGGLRVVNTFEKRLERAWAGLLPVILRDVYREFSGNGTAAQH